MRCSQARQALLQAEPQEMTGVGDTPLALHLRGCAACGGLAALFLREETRLGNALLRELPPPDLDAALDAAIAARSRREREATTAGGPWAVPGEAPRGPVRVSSRLKRVLTLLPLAAAAAIAALILSGEPPLPGDPYLPIAAPGVEAEAPPGRNLAVFRTADPDITVVWLF